MDDSLGTAGYRSVEFIVDRTRPVLFKVEILNNSKLLSDTDFTNNPNLDISMIAENPVNEKLTYTYLVSPQPLASPVIPDGNRPDTDTWPLPGSALNQRTNYLYIWAFDGAGNPSAPFGRIIRLDTWKSGIPVIESRTHRRAVTDLELFLFPMRNL